MQKAIFSRESHNILASREGEVAVQELHKHIEL